MPGERGLGNALHLQIDGEDQVIAGGRRLGTQVRDQRAALALHRAPLRIDQHLAEAVAAVQLALEGALDAELADQRGAGIGSPVDVLEILLADCTDVAERVHRQVAVRVEAGLARLDVQSRELEAAHREARHVLVRHAQPDRHAVEGAARVDGALDLVDVLGADQAELHQARQRLVDVRHLLGHQLELVGGLVAGDDLAAAVEDQAAGRRDRLGTHAVTLAELGVVIVARHLQQEQPHDQADGGEPHERCAYERALVEEALLAPVILDAYRRHGCDPSEPSRHR
jgi:hypothetical protein